jgi:exonuclease SbcC
MIKTIAHLSDIHIHNQKRHEEYLVQFEKLYNKLKNLNPDRILIAGDLFENFISVTNEAKKIAGNFLNNLANITKVIIVDGNHDLNLKDLKRISTVDLIVNLINNKNITYFNKSGFFDDENVVWVNHSHLEKKINPYLDINYVKDSNKIYIDIFHDPVYGSVNDENYQFNKQSYKKTSEFKGDFSMFGDIHKFQFLDKHKAYSSSIIQQNFGEHPNEHGFIFWNIIDKTSKFINLDNDYTLISFNIIPNFNYDNIIFNHELATINSNFRVVWKDYSANINNENESKIKKYFINKWNKEPVFLKNRIYTSISNVSSEKLTESININDKNIQQQIFDEYLKLNKYDEDFIKKIIKIDDIIDSRIEKTNQLFNIEWNIEKLWIDNFKSYNNSSVDFCNLNGIIQLHGKNQQGKTTLIDAICYCLYGTTLATNKLGGGQREKNGDNRYINNKKDLNYCEVGIILNINGEKYTLVRRTERKMNKDKKTISSVNTVFNMYIGDNIMTGIIQDEKLKHQTEKKINSCIGDFQDFVRLALTNSENLNELISLDRATFIDSIIKDAGFDIFEKKLEELKNYKKELSSNDINIDVNELEEINKTLNSNIDNYNQDIIKLKSDLSNIENSLNDILKQKSEKIKSLNKIDEDLISLNIPNLNQQILDFQENVKNLNYKQKTNIDISNNLKKEYDKDKLETLYIGSKKNDDDILNLKLEISQYNTDILKEENNIQKINNKIEQLKINTINNINININDINNQILDIKNNFNTFIKEQIQLVKDDIQNNIYKSNLIKEKIKTIKSEGINYKKQIKSLEESKICPTCKRELEECDKIHIEEEIKNINNTLEELLSNAIKLQNEDTTIQNIINELNLILNNFENKNFPDNILLEKNKIDEQLNIKNQEKIDLNSSISNIKNDIFEQDSELEKNISHGNSLITNANNKIIEYKNNINLNNSNIKKIELENRKIQDDILAIEKDKNDTLLYEKIIQENNEIKLKIENIKLTIDNINYKLNKFEQQQKYIKENNIIQIDINNLENLYNQENLSKQNINNQLSDVLQKLAICQNQLNNNINNINLYLKQIKRDELLKEYQKCVHRDGIPTYLLQKSKNIINNDLSDFLNNVDFNVFFDDNINLKLSHDITPDIVQNCLESSGKERVFAAVALKMSLRNLNNRSKPSFILFDEVMTKLIDNSVDEFNILLKNAKNKIDKIIIIEHVHPIEYNHIIDIKKDNTGVSNLIVY